jgi:hypothetical protein
MDRLGTSLDGKRICQWAIPSEKPRVNCIVEVASQGLERQTVAFEQRSWESIDRGRRRMGNQGGGRRGRKLGNEGRRLNFVVADGSIRRLIEVMASFRDRPPDYTHR